LSELLFFISNHYSFYSYSAFFCLSELFANLPNRSEVSHFHSTLPQLSSLRISIYDLPKTFDDNYCPIIAKITSFYRDLGFYFRWRLNLPNHEDFVSAYDNHRQFIKQLCRCILLLSVDKQPHYSMENEGYGHATWFWLTNTCDKKYIHL